MGEDEDDSHKEIHPVRNAICSISSWIFIIYNKIAIFEFFYHNFLNDNFDKRFFYKRYNKVLLDKLAI